MKTEKSPGFFRMQALAAAIGLASGAAHAVDPVVTNLNDAGPGSLRQAMLDASVDGGAASLITFAEGLSGTIGLQSVLPTMYDTVDIRGGGLITVRGPSFAEGQAVFRFAAESSQAFTLRGLTVTRSKAGAVDASLRNNGSNVLLQDMVITGNTDDSAVHVRGGNMVVLGSEISGNQSNGAGSYGGGGIAIAYGNLTLEDTSVSGNQVGNGRSGGGILSRYGNVTLKRSVISGNRADNVGGGLLMSSYEGFVLTLEDSSISGNTAVRSAGIHADSYGSSRLYMRDSSITDNRSTDDTAGLLFHTGRYSSGLVAIENSVIQGNQAGDDNGGLSLRVPTVDISGSVISNNTAADDRGAFRIYASTMNITRSTISGNKAPGWAIGRISPQRYGGVSVSIDETTISGHVSNDGPALQAQLFSEGSLAVTNSTLSGNRGSESAIIVNANSYPITSNVQIINSTFSANSSTRAPSAIQLSNVDLTVTHSTFVNNSGISSQGFDQTSQLSLHNFNDDTVSAQLQRSVFTSSNDAEMMVGGGTFNPFGENYGSYVVATLDNVIMTQNIAVAENSNMVNAPRVEAADLAPLGYRGGFTLVHEPLPGSSAIDTGSEGLRPDNRDQRGLSGNVNYNSDIGAVEVVGNTAPRMVASLAKRISGKVGTEVPPIVVSSLFTDDEGDIISTLNVTGLPNGLLFNEGAIYGTLNVAGSFSVTVTVADNNAMPLQTIEQFVVEVTDGSGGGGGGGSIPAGALALFGFLAMLRRRQS